MKRNADGGGLCCSFRRSTEGTVGSDSPNSRSKPNRAFLGGDLTFRPVLTFFSFVGAPSLLSVCRCEHATVHIVTVKGQLEGTGLLLPPCVLCVALSSLGLVARHLYHLVGLSAPAIVSRKEFK